MACSRSLTAIVTGSSDGIGREFAVQLAAKKLNIVLAARRKDKLEDVARECRELGVQAKVVICDFSDLESAGWKELAAVVEEIHKAGDRVTVLVNNAGCVGKGTCAGSSPTNLFHSLPLVTQRLLRIPHAL